MELKPGYKQTEVGVIPEDWVTKCLSELTSQIGDGIHTTPQYSGASQYHFINGNNLVDGVVEITDSTMCVSKVEWRKLRKNLVAETILISINGTVGNLAFYDGETVVLGKSAAYLNVLQGVSREYIFYSLSSSATANYFNDQLTGTTIRNLSLASLRDMAVPLPPLPEQRAIADALSDTDALLSSLDRLLAKKRDIKQAVMQQLLTGKQRLPGFSEEWEVKRLGEIGSLSKGKGLAKDCISLSGSLPAIPYTAIYTEFAEIVEYSKIKQYTNFDSEHLLVKGPVLLIAGSSNMLENIGKATAYVDDLDVAVGGDIILYKSAIKVRFLAYLLSTRPHRAKIRFLSQGSTIRHVYASTFASYDVSLPTLAEQTAIAAVLSDMDAEIGVLQERRDKTRAIKQGMMQELLTGRTRLV